MMITLKFGDKYKFEASYDELVDRTTLPLGDEDEREVELPWSSGLGWALQYVLELRNEEGEDNYEEKWNDFCDLPFTAKKLILDVEEHFYFKYRQFTIRSLQCRKGWVYPPELRPSWNRIYKLSNLTA